jgi:hypothetical protein
VFILRALCHPSFKYFLSFLIVEKCFFRDRIVLPSLENLENQLEIKLETGCSFVLLANDDTFQKNWSNSGQYVW